jgi:hypothetical protein
VLFLGGLGRSGTTLLERLLAELPGACAAGELVHLWQRGVAGNERCGCTLPFAECPFWTAVGKAAFGGWDTVDLDRIASLQQRVERTRDVPVLAAPRLPEEFRAAVVEYAGYYQRLYTAIAAVSGAEVVIDSSKHASLAFCLRWRSDLDLRVLHVVRDSRAVAYSWTKEVQRPEAEPGELMTRYSPSRSALLWNADNLALELLGRVGTPVQRMRYEDLTSNPATTFAAVTDFAGLSVPAEQADLLRQGTAQLGRSHTVAGNPMRFRTGPTRIREDASWRTNLASKDRRVVSALTAPLLARYGYPVRTGAA